MKVKGNIIFILVFSIIGLGFGVYYKYFKSFLGNKIQISSHESIGEYSKRQPNLNETISYLEELEETVRTQNIENHANEMALKNLKRINWLAVVLMVISAFLIFLAFGNLFIKEIVSAVIKRSAA